MDELDRLIMHLNGDGGIKVDGDPIQLAVDYLKELKHQNDDYSNLIDRANTAEMECHKLSHVIDVTIDFIECKKITGLAYVEDFEDVVDEIVYKLHYG